MLQISANVMLSEAKHLLFQRPAKSKFFGCASE
jgi:hypothetical protein